MFRKIVSNLHFSPTLIGELGYYAKRLKKEETTRRLGLILTAMALVVQHFLVFSPPESANAANASDLIHGGINTKTQLLSAWDNNTQGYRELLQHVGITRSNLVDAKSSEINTRTSSKDNGWLSWGRVSRGGAKYNETAHHINKQTVYVRSLAALDTGGNVRGGGSYYPSFVGTTSKGERFAIIKSCANLAMKTRPKVEKNIKVCEIATKKIVIIQESKFNSSKHSKDLTVCDDKPIQIQVCELASRKIVTIDESKFNSSKHSKDLAACDDKPIQVCDLSSLQTITIDERDFDARKHSKNLEDCKPKPVPTASCSSLTVSKVGRTEVELKASASATNGAAIKSYTFIVKDRNGAEVLRQTVNTSATMHAIKKSFPNEGSYTVKVIVSTSLGDKTSEGCQGGFVVEPIERCPLNPDLAINDPDCQPCPGDPSLWVKDEDCAAKVIRNKKATNLTAGKSAESITAKSSDRIEFVLSAKNDGKDDATFIMEDDLSDVLEYSNLYNRGDGVLDEVTKTLSWGEITLKPGEQLERTYVVQLASSISPRPQGASDPTSYDCRMINVFGNPIQIDVDCPAPKIIEQTVVTELPRTGPTENLVVGGLAVSVITFLYMRSRQLNKEVRLVRREVTAGTI